MYYNFRNKAVLYGGIGGRLLDKCKNSIDIYYTHIEKELHCNTLDELMGKKYVVDKHFGTGNLSRLKIEEGIEIAKSKLNKTEFCFDNMMAVDNILEVGYCYRGSITVIALPEREAYTIKEGDIFIYKALNNISHFSFYFNNCEVVSVHMNFNLFKNVINPIWKDTILNDWENNINAIFKEKTLVIQKASRQLEKIAQQIHNISLDNIMECMQLKAKTIEFLNVFFQEKSIDQLTMYSKTKQEVVKKTKEIISKNIEKPLTVKKLAKQLNISEYKLQEAFKTLMGYTVYEYIKKEKVEKAKYLLKNTEMPILEIVNEVGYENPSKFANLFKEYANTTPLKYRKINK